MTATVLTSTVDAPWLPPGGRADVVLDPGGEPPTPTGLVRLLVRRGSAVFCVPRTGSGTLDLPTRHVDRLDDGRSTAVQLALDVLGDDVAVGLVGYVRNVVPHPDGGYPWPAPLACFSVWTADGEPRLPGAWVDVEDPSSPLRDRHWWPLARQQSHPDRPTPRDVG